VDNVVEMLNDPKVEFSPTPKGIMAFADFMHGTGAIKAKPASWKDAFIPELHAAPGN
jgi:NitT/TauT family transport system substrate-binding protein